MSTAPAATNGSGEKISTGVPGLDEVLAGGVLPRRSYLISGPPGMGKTTIGWHFLTAGLSEDAPALFVTFGESEAQLRANARRSGFAVDDITICDLSPSADLFTRVESYDIFSAAEVDREPLTGRIVDVVRDLRPKRVFLDSMTHLRYLMHDNLQFRRQALSFIRFLIDSGATVMLTSESTAETPDDDLRFLCDGVFELATSYRINTVAVTKYRGSEFRSGRHTIQLGDHGAVVFPRLVPARHAVASSHEAIPTGIPALDEMLHGGIERGTITLMTGPSGVGKSTIGMQFVHEAARRNERSAVYTFDERRNTLVSRCEQVNIPIGEMLENGRLSIVEIEALRYGPDEFANLVRRDVEANGTRLVMIDSVSGYRVSVAGEDLTERLHGLCRYLQNVGVTVVLVNELQNLSEFRISDIGISYLADNIIFLRYIETRRGGRAQLGRAIGVLKKRLSDFSKSLRTFEFTPTGVVMGEALPHLSGILNTVMQGFDDSTVA